MSGEPGPDPEGIDEGQGIEAAAPAAEAPREEPAGEPNRVAATSEPRVEDPRAALDEAEAEAAERLRQERLPSILESLLFAADRPLSAIELAEIVEEPLVMKIEGALLALAAAFTERGVQLHQVAGGWQLRTHPRNAVWVQRLVAQKPVRLSRSQLETMAIIAYRQPITRPEIDEIRGVDTGGTLKTLLERSLIRILGKKEEPGRPLLYGTTRDFLEFFNLSDLRELPTLREFQELSEEHRAQVEALERRAPPGSIEPGQAGQAEAEVTPLPPPLARVELSDEPLEEDMGRIDQLIDEAGTRARAAAEALGTAMPEPAEPTAPPPPGSAVEE